MRYNLTLYYMSYPGSFVAHRDFELDSICVLLTTRGGGGGADLFKAQESNIFLEIRTEK